MRADRTRCRAAPTRLGACLATALLAGLPVRDAGAQAWVDGVEADLDRRIADGRFALVLAGLERSDVRDGPLAYRDRPPTASRRPPADADRPGDDATLTLQRVRGVLLRDCVLSADAVEEALKISASEDVVVQDCVLRGGREDALDIVRGRRFVFRRVTFVARGDRAVTIKGGVVGVDFIDCRFAGDPGAGHFVELGNWSDYDLLDRPPTVAVRIDDRTRFPGGRAPSRPYAVHVMHAEPPAMRGHVSVMPRLLVDAFFLFKRIADRRRILARYSRENLCRGLPACAP